VAPDHEYACVVCNVRVATLSPAVQGRSALRTASVSTPYDNRFFEAQSDESSRSAAVVVPLVHDMLKPASVLDVGCGTGTWLQVWMELGVTDLMGLDGPYVSHDRLRVPAENYLAVDLTESLDLGRSFDLVSCLEVAEHIDSSHARTLVHTLTRHGDIVLFSAAVPGQPGTHHVNSAWPSYWVQLFGEQGWQVLDLLRAKLWQDERIGWCYRQNLLLFVSPQGRALPSRFEHAGSPMQLDIAHPGLVHELTRPQGVRAQTRVWLREALWSARRKLTR
jgi:SAM-dependent methyltransferase